MNVLNWQKQVSAVFVLFCLAQCEYSCALAKDLQAPETADVDAFELRKLWNISAEFSPKIRDYTLEWMPETKSYFKNTFDWRSCLSENARPHHFSVGTSLGTSLMDPGLEPDHSSHREITNYMNPQPVYNPAVPAPFLVPKSKSHLRIDPLLLQYAESYMDCKISFSKVMDFKTKWDCSRSGATSKLANDPTMISLNRRIAEDLQSNFEKSIRKFSVVAGEQAADQLLKDIGASK